MAVVDSGGHLVHIGAAGEDPIDAVVCAYVALYAQRCPADVTIYGDFATGYIVTPSLPADRAGR